MRWIDLRDFLRTRVVDHVPLVWLVVDHVPPHLTCGRAALRLPGMHVLVRMCFLPGCATESTNTTVAPPTTWHRLCCARTAHDIDAYFLCTAPCPGGLLDAMAWPARAVLDGADTPLR